MAVVRFRDASSNLDFPELQVFRVCSRESPQFATDVGRAHPGATRNHSSQPMCFDVSDPVAGASSCPNRVGMVYIDHEEGRDAGQLATIHVRPSTQSMPVRVRVRTSVIAACRQMPGAGVAVCCLR